MAPGRLDASLMWWSWATAFMPSSLPGTPTPAERQSPNSTVSCWHRGSSTSTPITTRQVLWDPDLTPSSWHGVTSVVVGNCGFGIAPMRPANRTTIVSTLENVEGMSAEALDEGIDWCFETFAEYLGAVDRRRPRLNFAALVGHTPIRLSVLGDAASCTARPRPPRSIACGSSSSTPCGPGRWASPRRRSPCTPGPWGSQCPADWRASTSSRGW